MKVDWKAVSRSEGYRSLKTAYMKDLQAKHRSRSKEELYKRFQWAIGRAMHYAVRQGREVHHVLKQWELERQGWWFGWYTDQNFRKLPSGKPRNVRPISLVTYARKGHWHSQDPIRRFDSIRKERRRVALHLRKLKEKKPRWPAERKRRQAQHRQWLAKRSL